MAMEHGRIVEQGTYPELSRNPTGSLARLVTTKRRSAEPIFDRSRRISSIYEAPKSALEVKVIQEEEEYSGGVGYRGDLPVQRTVFLANKHSGSMVTTGQSVPGEVYIPLYTICWLLLGASSVLSTISIQWWQSNTLGRRTRDYVSFLTYT